MGNSSSQKKGFKGQGHVLGGTGNTTSQPRQAAGGSKGSEAKSKAAVRAKPKPRQKRSTVTLTEEQRAAQRAQQQKAAEARGRQWDDRLSRNRQKRAAAKHEEIQEDSIAAEHQSLGAQDLGPMDPKLKSQLEADAAKLEQSGFDLYQPTFASSGNGRAVIAMQGEGFATQDTTDERVTVQGETVDTNVVIGQLEKAMEACNLDVLRNTIAFARANVKNCESTEVGPALQRAVELAAVLQQSVGGDNLSSSDMDSKAALGTLTVLKKLLTNFVSHPQEAKFQRVRLANKAIQTKLVQPAEGAALVILEACGFERQQSAEDNDEILRVPGDKANSCAARSKVVLSHLENSIAELEERT